MLGVSCRDGNSRPFAGPFRKQILLTRLSRRRRLYLAGSAPPEWAFGGESEFRAELNGSDLGHG